jgi:FdhD protein
VLVVSGRASFDVVQKALVGGAGALIALGAPSSLAVDMAHHAGLPLYGFAKRDAVERYA